jgi:hypothetical protein
MPVKEIRDPSKALRLTLRAEHAIGGIQTLEQGVVLGTDAHNNAHVPLLGGRECRRRNGDSILSERVAAAGYITSVNGKVQQREVLAPIEINAFHRDAGCPVAGLPYHGVGDGCGATFAHNKVKVEGQNMNGNRLVVKPIF